MRGFGGSSHPGDVQTSGTMGDIVGDLVCLLQHAKVTKAICVGLAGFYCLELRPALTQCVSHDWGSQICYEAARMRPDLFDGVVGVVVPVRT